MGTQGLGGNEGGLSGDNRPVLWCGGGWSTGAADGVEQPAKPGARGAEKLGHTQLQLTNQVKCQNA